MIVGWTAESEKDLDEIWHHIADDNPAAADRMMDRLRTASFQLVHFPQIGRPGRKRRTRELVVGGTPFIFIYRAKRDAVEILRVRHGKQKWPPSG